jgi:hypothetical protein
MIFIVLTVFPPSLKFPSVGGICMLQRADASCLPFQQTALTLSCTLGALSPLSRSRCFKFLIRWNFLYCDELCQFSSSVDGWNVVVSWSSCHKSFVPKFFDFPNHFQHDFLSGCHICVGQIYPFSVEITHATCVTKSVNKV